MDGDQRAQVEEKMKRRDRRAARGADGIAGAEGRRKARMPAFLVSDEEDSEDENQLLGRRRTRRGYDEVEGDDENGFEEVSSPFLHFLYPQGNATSLCRVLGAWSQCE